MGIKAFASKNTENMDSEKQYYCEKKAEYIYKRRNKNTDPNR